MPRVGSGAPPTTLLRARCNRLLSPTGSSPIRATPRCKDEAMRDERGSGKQLTEISQERVAPRVWRRSLVDIFVLFGFGLLQDCMKPRAPSAEAQAGRRANHERSARCPGSSAFEGRS